MRAAGRPRSSTVASVIALADGIPPSIATESQRCASTNGSGSQLDGSSGGPWYCSPRRQRCMSSSTTAGAQTDAVPAAGWRLSHLVLVLRAAAFIVVHVGHLHEVVDGVVNAAERGLELPGVVLGLAGLVELDDRRDESARAFRPRIRHRAGRRSCF